MSTENNPKKSIRNPRYTGHVRQRKNGTWEGQFWFDGERRSIYGSTERETRAKLNEVQAQIYNGKYINETTESTAYWMIKWLKSYIIPTVRPATITSYEGYIRVHIIPYMGHIKLKNLKTAKIQEFINYLHTEGNRRKGSGNPGLSPKTLRNIRNMLSAALEKAVELDLINRNPIHGVKLPKVPKPKMRVFSEAEYKKLTDFCVSYDHPIAKGILVLLYTGIRRGELLGLCFPKITLSSYPKIALRCTLTRMIHPDKHSAADYERIDTWSLNKKRKNKTGLYLGPIKTEEGNREIPLADKAVDAINWLIDYQERYRQKYKGFGEFNPHQFLLCNPIGRPIDPKHFEDWFKQIVEMAGVDYANIHATRHSFATMIIRKTKDLAAAKKILGHADLQTTMIYTHVYDDIMRSAISMLD